MDNLLYIINEEVNECIIGRLDNLSSLIISSVWLQ